VRKKNERLIAALEVVLNYLPTRDVQVEVLQRLLEIKKRPFTPD